MSNIPNLHYILTPLILIFLDFIWISLNTKYGIYSHLNTQPSSKPQNPFTTAPPPSLSLKTTTFVALIGYIPPILALLLMPQSTLHQAALFGFFLAGIVYTVYNATAYIAFPIWRRALTLDLDKLDLKIPIPIAFLDTCWGVFLYTIIAMIDYGIARV